jgi:hypothetical protein
MARPQKEGIDYFPLSCQFDDSVKLIQAEFGLVGLGILIRLWQKIYGGRGYYTAWDSDVALVFSSECGVGASVVREVVSACLRRGIFDKSMHDQYGILTSEGIQERYAEATERRSSQKIDFRYLLISIPKNWVNVDNNSVFVNNNAENVDNNPQSKVNNSKHTKETSSLVCNAPTREDVVAYCRERGYPFGDKFYAHYQALGWKGIKDFRAKADEWQIQDAEKKTSEGRFGGSFDADEFFDAAVRCTYGMDQ